MKVLPAVILSLAALLVQAIEEDPQSLSSRHGKTPSAGTISNDTINLRGGGDAVQRSLQRGGRGPGGGRRPGGGAGGDGGRPNNQGGGRPNGGNNQGGRPNNGGGGGQGGGGGGGQGGGGGGGGGGTVPTTGNIVHQTPSEISSSNGVLSTIISIDEGTYTIPGSTVTVSGRLLNGQYPGPTLRIRAGDRLEITYNNNLENRGSAYQHNRYSANDDSNMHFHGLHISGELPSDDVTHIVYPGESYRYEMTLPTGHLGGTHWQHPHKHGSTTLQVGGGALQAVIVEDDPGFILPAQVASAREVIFIAHYFNVAELQNVANNAQDSVLNFDIPAEDANEYSEFVTVNGQYRPIIEVDANEWIRLRVIWANFFQGDLDLGIPDCEMYLLAKDGIYIRDFPRSITDAAVVSGGRADIMVRCPNPNTSYPMNGIVDGLAYIQTSGTTVTSEDLDDQWTPNYPSYLSDLRAQTVSSGCDCNTRLAGRSINGFSFPNIASEGERYLHASYLGAVVARQLSSNIHPYHQHVYPFQLIGNGFNGNYNRVGDWHDTVKGTGEIRFSPTEFTGKVMLHCHRLVHEDLGMMAMEYVGPVGNSCSCSNGN